MISLTSSDQKSTNYEFFSGKGGVGKTTLSAARALYLAQNDEKVLIISTDPAHSLSDSLETEINHLETRINENLYAVEIDPEQSMDDLQHKIEEEENEQELPMDGLMDFGEDSLIDSFTGATPGMDEMAAFNKFIEHMHDDEYDYIIFDTAPSGHTLNFLSLPDVMESWVGKIIKIKSKLSQFSGMFKNMMPFGDDENEEEVEINQTQALEEMKEKIENAKEVMQDEELTRFWMVTIPQRMSLYETQRTIEDLNEQDITTSDVIINQIIPKNNDCEFCSERRARQLEVIEEIEKEFQRKRIYKLNQYRNELKGKNRLLEMGRKLYDMDTD